MQHKKGEVLIVIEGHFKHLETEMRIEQCGYACRSLTRSCEDSGQIAKVRTAVTPIFQVRRQPLDLADIFLG